MSFEPSIHKSQLAILRHLLFVPGARFAGLRRSAKLSSDHFTFHIKQLLQRGYIEKADNQYRLTQKGKEYANRLDTEINTIEKQPKVSVIITLVRQNEKGEKEYLFQQRKKNPYFDFWGRVGGKMRWGESVIEAAARELREETGLSARLEFRLVYHKRDFDKESGQLLEDKLFLCLYGSRYSGTLIDSFEGGVNRWMTMDELNAQPKKFSNIATVTEMLESGEHFVEKEFYYEPAEY